MTNFITFFHFIFHLVPSSLHSLYYGISFVQCSRFVSFALLIYFLIYFTLLLFFWCYFIYMFHSGLILHWGGFNLPCHFGILFLLYWYDNNIKWTESIYSFTPWPSGFVCLQCSGGFSCSQIFNMTLFTAPTLWIFIYLALLLLS